MSEQAKAEAEKIWSGLKPSIEPLAAKITAYYNAVGSTRHCRQINELWHPENAAIGIGFVPPEAIERLETLIIQSGLHLHKSNGPLGKAVYFSLLHDSQLTAERLGLLGGLVDKEYLSVQKDPPPVKTAPPTTEELAEEQIARVEGLTAARGDKLRSRPPEVSDVVDAFNGATMGMMPLQLVEFLEQAVTYFNLPDITRHELMRTLEMIRDAEAKAKAI